MKRFSFVLQPYEQTVIVYYNYTQTLMRRIVKQYDYPELELDKNAVYYCDDVPEITILLARHRYKVNLVGTIAHEAFHVVQRMSLLFELSMDDIESCAYLEEYIVKQLYEGCR